MEFFFLFFVLSVVVDGLVEYAKNLIAMADKRAVVLQLAALAASVLLCVLTGADLLAPFGVTFCVPFAGNVVTGVFASRGANYASDLVGRLNRMKENEAG